jgi:hypothetical protein
LPKGGVGALNIIMKAKAKERIKAIISKAKATLEVDPSMRPYC